MTRARTAMTPAFRKLFRSLTPKQQAAIVIVTRSYTRADNPPPLQALMTPAQLRWYGPLTRSANVRRSAPYLEASTTTMRGGAR